MPDPSIQPPVGVDWSALAAWFATSLVGVMAWLGLRVTRRVDKLEQTHVSREEFNETVSAMRRDMKEGFKHLEDEQRERANSVLDDIREIRSRMNHIADSLPRRD